MRVLYIYSLDLSIHFFALSFLSSAFRQICTLLQYFPRLFIVIIDPVVNAILFARNKYSLFALYVGINILYVTAAGAVATQCPRKIAVSGIQQTLRMFQYIRRPFPLLRFSSFFQKFSHFTKFRVDTKIRLVYTVWQEILVVFHKAYCFAGKKWLKTANFILF